MFGASIECRKAKRWAWLREFKIRAVMVLAVLAVFFGIIQFWVFDEDSPWAGYCAGLVTELAGVAITFLLVDFVLELQERKRDVRRLADELLYQTDYIVWVWLGGDRVFSLDEMECLLASVKDSDTLHPATETMLQNLGNEAAKRLRTHADVVNANEPLCRGVHALSRLAQLRVGQGQLSPRAVGQIVSEAVNEFDKVLCYRNGSDTPLQNYLEGKRSDVDAQWYRHSGEKK